MMRPQPRSSMYRSARRVPQNTAFRFKSSAFCHASSVISCTSAHRSLPPALFTRMSTLPYRFAAWSIRLLTSSSRRTSHCTNIARSPTPISSSACSPLSCDLPLMTTAAPWASERLGDATADARASRR